jgi:uncharacterized membrane protein
VTDIFSLAPAARSYLNTLEGLLSDFPPEEREEILGDVESSLLDLPDADEVELRSRFGEPERFAAELRAAAGVETSAVAGRRWSNVRKRIAQLRTSRPFASIVPFGRRLAPIGWLIRGYVFVAAAALVVGSFSAWHPELPRFGNAAASLTILGFGLGASILVGLLAARIRVPVLLANAAAVVCTVPVVAHLVHRQPPQVIVFSVPAPAVAQPALAVAGRTVTNIYPYSRDGLLLHDVLLYDQNGAPLNLPASPSDQLRRILETRRGLPVLNAFPVRYFEPGTNTVAHPNAGPHITVPPLSTPPLEPDPRTPTSAHYHLGSTMK